METLQVLLSISLWTSGVLLSAYWIKARPISIQSETQHFLAQHPKLKESQHPLYHLAYASPALLNIQAQNLLSGIEAE